MELNTDSDGRFTHNNKRYQKILKTDSSDDSCIGCDLKGNDMCDDYAVEGGCIEYTDDGELYYIIKHIKEDVW